MSNFADGSEFSAEGLDAIIDGVNQDAFLTGGAPTKGTGNYDVDLTASDYVIGGTDYSASADTVTLSSASGSDRVDIITVDTAGNYTATEGTPATDPNAEDIPTNELLVCAVFVDSGGTSISSSDINDYRVFLTRDATTFKGNDIDTNGDGKVNSADSADDADTVDLRDATDLEDFSTTDDGSDITTAGANATAGATNTVANVSGSGFLMGGVFESTGNSSVDITIDGGATQSYSNVLPSSEVGTLPSIKYESSLLVEVNAGGSDTIAARITYL